MAVQLPTFQVSDAAGQRLLAAFGTAEAYKNWLKSALLAEVTRRELQVVADANRSRVQAQQSDLLAVIGTDLDPIVS